MRWNKSYIIVIDNYRSLGSSSAKSLHNDITTADGVINWWHYIDNTYIIIVEWGVTASSITEYVRKINSSISFFVCQVDLKNHNGFLPEEAWDWINNQTKLGR